MEFSKKNITTIANYIIDKNIEIPKEFQSEAGDLINEIDRLKKINEIDYTEPDSNLEAISNNSSLTSLFNAGVDALDNLKNKAE